MISIQALKAPSSQYGGLRLRSSDTPSSAASRTSGHLVHFYLSLCFSVLPNWHLTGLTTCLPFYGSSYKKETSLNVGKFSKLQTDKQSSFIVCLWLSLVRCAHVGGVQWRPSSLWEQKQCSGGRPLKWRDKTSKATLGSEGCTSAHGVVLEGSK